MVNAGRKQRAERAKAAAYRCLSTAGSKLRYVVTIKFWTLLFASTVRLLLILTVSLAIYAFTGWSAEMSLLCALLGFFLSHIYQKDKVEFEKMVEEDLPGEYEH